MGGRTGGDLDNSCVEAVFGVPDDAGVLIYVHYCMYDGGTDGYVCGMREY